jgi:hypothetical protein
MFTKVQFCTFVNYIKYKIVLLLYNPTEEQKIIYIKSKTWFLGPDQIAKRIAQSAERENTESFFDLGSFSLSALRLALCII